MLEPNMGASGLGGERISRLPRCGGPGNNNPCDYVVLRRRKHHAIDWQPCDRLGQCAPRSARKSVLSARRGHCFVAWHRRGSTHPASRGRVYSSTADSCAPETGRISERQRCAPRCCTRAILAQMQRHGFTCTFRTPQAPCRSTSPRPQNC